MKIESVVKIVNTLCKEDSYSKARPLILNEWSRLSESKNYHLLNTSAQEFMKIIQEEKANGSLEVLSNSDKKTLNLIISSVRTTQFSYAKRIMAEHQGLLDKPEAQRWLTSDARIIYEAWKSRMVD